MLDGAMVCVLHSWDRSLKRTESGQHRPKTKEKVYGYHAFLAISVSFLGECARRAHASTLAYKHRTSKTVTAPPPRAADTEPGPRPSAAYSPAASCRRGGRRKSRRPGTDDTTQRSAECWLRYTAALSETS